MNLTVPARLAASCRGMNTGTAWLDRLPAVVHSLTVRWSLTPLPPFADASCAWVAPVARAGGAPAVLKIGLPHMEADHELDALRFWNGDAAVRLLDADESLGALLLERCQPGTPLRALPEPEQDVVLAGLLRRLWRTPPAPHPFRPLAAMLRQWAEETLRDAERWSDPGLVRAGLALFEELAAPRPGDVLLATDLHAGNVLRSAREPWLAIDPKPFLGDRAYDATQHLLNCPERLESDAQGTIARFADLLELDRERVRLWLFARAAAGPWRNWDPGSLALAGSLAP